MTDFTISKILFSVSALVLLLLLISLAQRLTKRWLRRGCLTAIPFVVTGFLLWTWYLVAEREAEKLQTPVAIPGLETTKALLEHTSLLIRLPWHWILHAIALLAFVVGAIFILRERRRRQAFCSEPLLHDLKLGDKDAIKKWVKVCFVRCEPHINVTGDERQFVDFRVCILSLSLVEVSIEPVSGYITFIKAPPYEEAIRLDGKLKLEKNERALNQGFRSEGWFIVRQYIPDYQVGIVAAGNNQSTFYFQNLDIMITGEGFDPVRLDMPAQVQKGNPWTTNFETDFVFADVALLRSQIKYLQTNYSSRMDRIEWLSEVIGRANGLERVYQDPQFIPLEHMKALALEINEAIQKCYGDKSLEKFYPFPFTGESMEGPEQYGLGPVQWFIDYRNQLIACREREQRELEKLGESAHENQK